MITDSENVYKTACHCTQSDANFEIVHNNSAYQNSCMQFLWQAMNQMHNNNVAIANSLPVYIAIVLMLRMHDCMIV